MGAAPDRDAGAGPAGQKVLDRTAEEGSLGLVRALQEELCGRNRSQVTVGSGGGLPGQRCLQTGDVT